MAYNYRMVYRNSLGELEQAVRHLEREQWELLSADNDMTLVEALNFLNPNSPTRAGVQGGIKVNMRREINGHGTG